MFKVLLNLVMFTKPVIGTRLVSRDWGREYTEIEIVDVSINSKSFLYKFITVKGTDCTSDSSHSTYSGEWPWILDIYDVVE